MLTVVKNLNIVPHINKLIIDDILKIMGQVKAVVVCANRIERDILN